ncbi:DUF1778 domain-containing protein [Pigmentiphaga aceris]|uniref:DUF1778 domain-containing protein n=1 Tax=Pigmentiphaga aceris TaxID=1940612 RepID=A0A5C0B4P1_9BURK|nr:DUF1778 domain-containing protein [Pigmentiphaga aceris]QEI08826.1 DUF1778 domain-containing protein [Pigmentiphaga aceris]
MGTLAIKDARLELKTTKETKELLTKAALLDGMDLSSFMLASAMKQARATLQNHSIITLSAEGQARLVELLHAQPEPTEAMKALRKLPRLKTRAE